jgi:hypothetical protein
MIEVLLMMNRKIRNFLGQNKKQTKQKKRRGIKVTLSSDFFTMLINNELKFSLMQFLMLSVISGVAVYFLYLHFTKSNTFSIICGLFGLTVPYLALRTNAVMNRVVENALEYKAFIGALESAMRATNSTREALIMVANDPSVSPVIRNQMEEIVTEIKLGGTIDGAIKHGIKNSQNVYFSMALSILKINHNVGSSSSIEALNNIQHQMDLILDNIQLLKDKISGIVSQKIIFLLILIAVPVIQVNMMSDFIGDFYLKSTNIIVMSIVYAWGFIGNFLVDLYASKMIRSV